MTTNKTVGELHTGDLGHIVRFNDVQGMLVRVLHERTGIGPAPTYLRLLIEDLTESVVMRVAHDTPTEVLPLPEVIVVDADPVESPSGLV
jgi:hypothetical protein